MIGKIGLAGLYLAMSLFTTEPANDTAYIPYTEDEINLMARVVMSEGSILSYDSKKMIAQVIINRVNSDEFPDTVEEVIFQPNQFSTCNNGEPGPDCYKAVDEAIMEMEHPNDLLYFRLDFVQYGYEYAKDGNTYFSTTSEHKRKD